MDKKPIIDYEDYLNDLIRQENEYIMNRLYFKCHYCEAMIPIRNGTIVERNVCMTGSIEKGRSGTIRFSKEVALVCSNCLEVVDFMEKRKESLEYCVEIH